LLLSRVFLDNSACGYDLRKKSQDQLRKLL
jgi:hypothetical protein